MRLFFGTVLKSLPFHLSSLETERFLKGLLLKPFSKASLARHCSIIITYFKAWQEIHLDHTKVLLRVYSLLVRARATCEVKLTLRRFRQVRGEECGITVSLVGMDPDINLFFNWINSPFSRGTAMGLCSKQLSSKWTEHSTDEFEGVKSLRCLRTNLIHFW